MKNPYDVYNDNRAYMGYEKAIADVLDLIRLGKDVTSELEVENDRFRRVFNVKRDSVLKEEGRGIRER